MYFLNYTRAALVGLAVGFLPWLVVSVGIAILYHFAGLPDVLDVDDVLLQTIGAGISLVVGFIVTSNISLAGDVIARADDLRGQALEVATVVAAFLSEKNCSQRERKVLNFVTATLRASFGDETDERVQQLMREALAAVVDLARDERVANRVAVYLCRTVAALSTVHGSLRTLQDRRVPSCVEVSVLGLAVLNVLCSLETVKPESFGRTLLLSTVITLSSAGLSGTVRDPLERAAFSFRIRPAVRQTVATIESFWQTGGLPKGSAIGTGWMRVSGFS